MGIKMSLVVSSNSYARNFDDITITTETYLLHKILNADERRIRLGTILLTNLTTDAKEKWTYFLVLFDQVLYQDIEPFLQIPTAIAVVAAESIDQSNIHASSSFFDQTRNL